MTDHLPRLTVCGSLDGLVRTSRIAEAYHQSILSVLVPCELHKPEVLIEGMVGARKLAIYLPFNISIVGSNTNTLRSRYRDLT
jgi:hypothetical protein